VAICSVISGFIVSVIGGAVIDPPPELYFTLPRRSGTEGCILGMSAGDASRLGILPEIDEV
jgi:hypothetical protein